MLKTKDSILYIEDDQVDQLSFKRFFSDKPFPYSIEIKSSIAECNDLDYLNKFSAIICDYNLKDGNAFDIFSPEIIPPIIIVTSAGNERIAVEAIKMGFENFIVKDVDSNYLMILPTILQKAIENKQYTRTLEVINSRNQSLIKNSRDTFIIINEQNRISYVSDNISQYGYITEDLLKTDIHLIIQTETNEVIEFCHKSAKADKKIPIRLLLSSKKFIPAELIVKCKEESFGINGTLLIIREKAAISNTDYEFNLTKLEQVIGLTPQPIVVTNADLKIIDANKSACTLLGVAVKTDLLAKNIIQFVSGEFILNELNQNKNVGPQFENVLLSGIRMDGKKFPAEISINKIRNSSTQEFHYIFILRDLTERKRLEERWSLFNKFSEASGQGLGMSEFSGNIIYSNPALIKLLNTNSLEDTIGLSIFDFFDTGFSAKFNTEILKTIISENNWQGEATIINPNKVPVVLSFFTIPGEKGEPQYLAYVITDISNIKKIELALNASESRFKNIYNSVNDAIFITNLKGDIIEYNNIFESYKKSVKSEKNIVNVYQLVPEYHHERVRQKFHELTHNESAIYEADSHLGNHISTFEISSKLVRIDDKILILNIARDISVRKEIQRNLVNSILQSEEKDRKQFANDLHDGIGPLLSSAKFYLKTIQDDINDKNHLEAIENANRYIDNAIQQVKEISNQISPHILVNFGLSAALKFLCNRIQRSVKSQIFLKSNLLDRIDNEMEVSIFRIVEELLKNTVKHAKAQNIHIFLNHKNNNVSLYYKDDGIGFDLSQAQIDHTGHGIDNIYRRVRLLKAKVDLKSILGKGMEFKLDVDTKQG